MIHVVTLSGGTASAVAASRVIERYSGEDIRLFFADTSWEDEDLYRFLDDLEAYWEKKIDRFVDGRNPLEVAEQRRLIPNQKRAPCSVALKVEPCVEFLAGLPKPVTLHLGLDITEQHRAARPKHEYEKIDGVSVDLPLLWKPPAFPPHRRVVESWGIKAPRLYDLGFPHNNCGGRCVKQGIAEWLRLKVTFPERFEQVAAWEEAQRAKGGARANFGIARDQSGGKVVARTLREIEAMADTAQISMMPSQEDNFACFCSY